MLMRLARSKVPGSRLRYNRLGQACCLSSFPQHDDKVPVDRNSTLASIRYRNFPDAELYGLSNRYYRHMTTIDEEDALKRFDLLVQQGEIKWAQTEPVHRSVSDFDFEFRVIEAFANKPENHDSDDEKSDSGASDQDGRRTKSDIRNDGPLFNIAEIGPHHDLVLNRFCVYRPQYILLTKNPVHDQHEPLDQADIAAALELLHASSSPIFVIYNCGELAGCSRSHRHMQAFPSPGSKANTAKALFPDRLDQIDEKKIPFKYYLFRFEDTKGAPSEQQVDTITKRYLSDLEKARRILKIEKGDHIPHNVILTKQWLMVIPRRGGKVGGSAVNAAGMMGMVWTKNQDELKAWQKLGIDESLAKFGVPRDEPDPEPEAQENGAL